MAVTALRRADCRFLLPTPPDAGYRRLVLCGGGADLLERLGDMADERHLGPERLREADLVIVTVEGDRSVGRVLADLRDDATVYLEIDRRRPRNWFLTPGRLRGLLRRRGFRILDSHWVVPGFAAARRHIPLKSGPLRWYLDTLHTAGSPLSLLADAGIRMLAARGEGTLAAWVPSYSVIAVGPGRRPSSLAGIAPDAETVAMITSGQDDGSRVVLLPFGRGESAPEKVIKLSRSSAFEGHTVREQHTLTELRRHLAPKLQHLVPQPLGMHRRGRTLVASETYAAGKPLVVTSGRYGVPFETAAADLECAVTWIIEFQRETMSGATWTGEWADRTTERFRRCESLLGHASAGRHLLHLAAERARALIGARVPIVPLHNDLGPWNMHRDGGRVTVIDWELGHDAPAGRMGPGPCDFFYFVTYWYLRVRRLAGPVGEARGIRTLFAEPESRGRPAEAVAEASIRYREQLDITASILPVLLVSTWVERALDRADREGMGNAAAAGASRNRYLRYLEVLGERADPWFKEDRWP